jgi:hypothetical protein
MANTYNWKINALDTYPSKDDLTDVVYNIHWGFEAVSDKKNSDGEYHIASSIGTYAIGDPEKEAFTAFDKLTAEIVEKWLEDSDMDIAAMKASLDAQLVEIITPTSVTKQLPVVEETEEETE